MEGKEPSKQERESVVVDYPNTELYIGGEWRCGDGERRLDVVNPATEAVIGSVAQASKADLDHALAAAEDGWDRWRRVSAYDRAAILREAGRLLRERVDAIATIMTLEQGKPLGEARIEVRTAADVIDWCAGEAQRSYGWVIPARAPGITQIAARFPVGPVAAFTPWNFPINQAVRKVAAALAAGCSVILKGAEETPASVAQLVQVFVDAGLPDGVLNLVFGVPAEISDYLIPHPVIRKVSFTGSTPVGKQLAALAGQHMKRATMELGGHAPVIVTADADLQSAVNLMVAHKFRNAGQVCVSPTRFLVEEPVADMFVERFVQAAEALVVGSGLDDKVQMGPLAHDRRIAAIEALVQDAIAQGGVLATGGQRIGNKGYFFAPTVLIDVPESSRIMNDEPFGPVASINRFKDLDAALAEANRLPVGLASYAFTGSAATADRLSAELEAGMLSINHLGIGLPELPFGGIGESGYGSEGGAEILDAYLETRMTTRLA